MKKITTFAPGKLVIAGEWAVLNSPNPAIVTTVNKQVKVTVKEHKESDIKIISPHFEFKTKADTAVIKAAIDITKKYLGKLQSFEIETDSAETFYSLDNNIKLGFGSSAAITVAAIDAILKFHEQEVNQETLYKLAALSHYNAQGKIGSAFDIAAAAFKKTISYSRFDPEFLEKAYNHHPLKEVLAMNWQGLKIEILPNLPNLYFLIGFTGKSASTKALVQQMNVVKNSEQINKIYLQIADTVNTLYSAWCNQNQTKIIELINQNHFLLKELTNVSKINILTPELELLADIARKHHSAGKLSGAGGGDCGIAVSFNKRDKEKIIQEWRDSGIIIIE